MLFTDDDIFRFTGFQQQSRINNKNQNSTNHSNKNTLSKNSFNFNPTYQNITQNIGKYFQKNNYIELNTINNQFCPMCLQIVQKNHLFTLCNINLRSYSIHDKCLIENPSFHLTLINYQEDQMFLIKNNHLSGNKKIGCSQKYNDQSRNKKNQYLQSYKFNYNNNKNLLINNNNSANLSGFNNNSNNLSIQKSQQLKVKSIKLSNRSFFIQITFCHPISEKKFWKIQKQLKINNSDNYFQLLLNQKNKQENNQLLYSPNILAFPLIDYLIDIKIAQIGIQNKSKTKKYVNFKKLNSDQNKNQIKFGNQQLQFFINIHKTQSQKQKIIEQLNYKYKYTQTNIITVNKLLIQIPQQLKQYQSDDSDQFFQASSSKMIQMLQIDKKQSDSLSQTTQKTLKSNISYQSKLRLINHRHYQIDQYQQLSLQQQQTDSMNRQSSRHQKQKQKINLDRLILTDQLKQFVKNNTQSRSFQYFLNKATNQQICKIIQCLKYQFVQLMKHEYGNYMMQKLFSVCNLQRRINILQILMPNLNQIIMNKQGTHAFQDFLSFLTTENEYQIILAKIRQNFYQLCIHNNSTHSIQKIIKIFPLEYLQQFYFYCIQNLYQFGCDKNGMCVIKYMMKKLSENNSIINIKLDRIKGQQINKLNQQLKKLFVQGTLFNIDGLIGDMYGNYVVQFNYQFFQPINTLILTQTILMKLAQYSLSKYSTNVVYKCLNLFWKKQQKPHVSHILKQIFQPYLVYEMYKNKDGNKILLQIMQKYQGYQIWNKLHSMLIEIQPTRFYHDRWGVCFGIRSGNVGGKWGSFTEAVAKDNHKSNNAQKINHINHPNHTNHINHMNNYNYQNNNHSSHNNYTNNSSLFNNNNNNKFKGN